MVLSAAFHLTSLHGVFFEFLVQVRFTGSTKKRFLWSELTSDVSKANLEKIQLSFSSNWTSRFELILYQMEKVSTSPGSGSRFFDSGLDRLLLSNLKASGRSSINNDRTQGASVETRRRDGRSLAAWSTDISSPSRMSVAIDCDSTSDLSACSHIWFANRLRKKGS